MEKFDVLYKIVLLMYGWPSTEHSDLFPRKNLPSSKKTTFISWKNLVLFVLFDNTCS